MNTQLINLNYTLYSNSNTGFEMTLKNFLLVLFLISLSILTICGNILVILAILFDFRLRSPAYFLIGSLAAADLLLGLLVLPFSAIQLYFDKWFFGEIICEIWLLTDVLCCTASIYLVLVISIDRFIAISKPLKYSSIMTKKRIGLIILSVWLFSLLLSVAPLLGLKSPQNSNNICEINQNAVYALGSASLSFYIPLAIILILYYRIFVKAKAQIKFFKTGIKNLKQNDNSTGNITLRIHIGPSNNNETRQNSCILNKKSSTSIRSLPLQYKKRLSKFRKEQKAAKTVSIVVGCLLLCWAPFFIILPIDALCKSCQIQNIIRKIFFWLGYCNSAMNPLIYALSSREFRA